MPGPSLLIVEDDPSLRMFLEQLFRLEGYVVTSASEGLRALNLLAAGFGPDLMLLDMHMEGLDGWGLAAELNQLGLSVPILVITADRQPQRCAEQVGARACLAKPLDVRELLWTAQRLIREKPA